VVTVGLLDSRCFLGSFISMCAFGWIRLFGVGKDGNMEYGMGVLRNLGKIRA
jgi:hypothetical protein